MIPVLVGRAPAEVRRRHGRALEIFPRVPPDEAGWRAAGFLYGAPAEVAQELSRWRAAGMSRVMLQMLDMDDLEAIDLLAREVVPGLR
jgi:hypothetical protein